MITLSDCTTTVTAEQDDIPVRGNALDSGDKDVDKTCEDEILARLDDGDVWAWASVRVSVTWRTYTGSAYLGCCSYASEDDFRESSGYFEAMREEAFEELMGVLRDASEALS